MSPRQVRSRRSARSSASLTFALCSRGNFPRDGRQLLPWPTEISWVSAGLDIVCNLSLKELCSFDAHPLRPDVAAYYEWKYKWTPALHPLVLAFAPPPKKNLPIQSSIPMLTSEIRGQIERSRTHLGREASPTRANSSSRSPISFSSAVSTTSRLSKI